MLLVNVDQQDSSGPLAETGSDAVFVDRLDHHRVLLSVPLGARRLLHVQVLHVGGRQVRERLPRRLPQQPRGHVVERCSHEI